MHAAWDVYEVRMMILAYLSSGDIARLGRTCSEMYDDVIDHIWQDIKSLDGFTRLLPSYPRTEPLMVADLERIDFYGRKVRRLDLTKGDGEPLQIPQTMRGPKPWRQQQEGLASNQPWIELWEEIALLRPQTAFLPNLQCLIVNNAATELLRPLVGISGAHLRSIYIKAIHEPKDLLRKFLGSFEETPKLEYLYVRNGLYHVPEVLLENSPLVTLRLDETVGRRCSRPPSVLFPVSSMRPSLNFLTVSLHEQWYDPKSWALDNKILPALRQLRLEIRDITGCKCHPHCNVCTLLYDPLQRQRIVNRLFHRDLSPDCRCRPPSVFIRGLEHPQLELLNIKFSPDVDAALLVDTMYAVVEACRLDNLAELVLSSGGWLGASARRPYCYEPRIRRGEIQELLNILGPLPRLRVLRLPLTYNFLQVLDLQDCERIAKAFPALQALTLGHRSCTTGSGGRARSYDRTPLEHVAAFCHLFPDLSDVEIGCVDATSPDVDSNPEWTCFNVRKLRVNLWIRSNDAAWERQMQQCRTYFPNANVNHKTFRSHRQAFT